ncbi:MAG: LysR family transcriptional regulator [Gammaproteobacteria bacterium]|nr:LysR family transcriptional regulator [Gammaproteobacteria bacterium]
MKHALPSLDALKVFEAAARLLSFSKAAEELCLSKGAVSYQVRKLEQDLDCALFRRSIRQVYLTDAGQQLYLQTRRLFDELGDTLARIKPASAAHDVTVGATTYVALRWLSPRIARFSERHPDISVTLQHSVNSREFRMHDVDFAIRWDCIGEGPRRGLLREMPMPLFPVCSPRLLERHGLPGARTRLDPRELVQGPLGSTPLLCEDRALDLWQTWYGEQSESLANPRRVIDDANVRTQAAIDGQGWTLADAMMEHELRTGALVAPFDRRLEGYGYLIESAPGRFLGRDAVTLRDWLVAEG